MYRTRLREKLDEALGAVLPVIAIVLALALTIAPVESGVLLSFLFGGVLLIVGNMFFTLGAELAMEPIGQHMGTAVTRSRSLRLLLAVGFSLGVLITVSEPDLQVLAGQVQSIPNAVLIFSVAGGVGLFLAGALLRILMSVRLRTVLLACYGLVFLLACFAPRDFLAVAFDAGGVTTGPMTVPFIMAFGIGVSAIRSDRRASDDSFGLISLCSVGPILAVLALSLIYRPDSAAFTETAAADVADSVALGTLFAASFPEYLGEIFRALLPIAAFFGVFQVFKLHLGRTTLLRIVVGLFYTYIGLVVFLDSPYPSRRHRRPGPDPGGAALSLDCHSAGDADRLLYCESGTGGICADAAGGGTDQRSSHGDGFAAEFVGGRVGIRRACHGAGFDGDFHFVSGGAGVRPGPGADAGGAGRVYGNCVRLRRGGLGAYDCHIPAPLCGGCLPGSGRQCGDGRFRRGGYGLHDAAHHHSAFGACHNNSSARTGGAGTRARCGGVTG